MRNGYRVLSVKFNARTRNGTYTARTVNYSRSAVHAGIIPALDHLRTLKRYKDALPFESLKALGKVANGGTHRDYENRTVTVWYGAFSVTLAEA